VGRWGGKVLAAIARIKDKSRPPNLKEGRDGAKRKREIQRMFARAQGERRSLYSNDRGRLFPFLQGG